MKIVNLFLLILALATMGATGCREVAQSGSEGNTVPTTNQNIPPIADAGDDKTVLVSSMVILDGSGSSDPDGNALSYDWDFLSIPPGSSLPILLAPTAVNPSFDPEAVGEYILSLVVNDVANDSASDTVVVIVTEQGGSFIAGQIKYDKDCASCHAAGSHDTTSIGQAGDLYMLGYLIKTDIKSYAPTKKADVENLTDLEIDDLKAFLDDPTIQP